MEMSWKSNLLRRLVVLAAGLMVVAGVLQAHAFKAEAGRVYQNVLRPFTSDGCSKFPDGYPFLDENKWLECCVVHDIAYWQGGTVESREKADHALEVCVEQAGASKISFAMFYGVRVGGYADLPTSWRWGYGWTIPRGYAPLTSAEQSQVDQLIRDIPSDLQKVAILSLDIIPERYSVTGDYCVDEGIKQIQSALGRPFRISRMQDKFTERSNGHWRTIEITPDGCAEPFRFTFQLLKKNACTQMTGEIMARGRIRLRNSELAASCH